MTAFLDDVVHSLLKVKILALHPANEGLCQSAATLFSMCMWQTVDGVMVKYSPLNYRDQVVNSLLSNYFLGSLYVPKQIVQNQQ